MGKPLISLLDARLMIKYDEFEIIHTSLNLIKDKKETYEHFRFGFAIVSNKYFNTGITVRHKTRHELAFRFDLKAFRFNHKIKEKRHLYNSLYDVLDTKEDLILLEEATNIASIFDVARNEDFNDGIFELPYMLIHYKKLNMKKVVKNILDINK